MSKFVVLRVQDSPEVVCRLYSKELAGKGGSCARMNIKVVYSPKIDMGKMFYLAQIWPVEWTGHTRGREGRLPYLTLWDGFVTTKTRPNIESFLMNFPQSQLHTVPDQETGHRSNGFFTRTTAQAVFCIVIDIQFSRIELPNLVWLVCQDKGGVDSVCIWLL